ncbi:hypothetical protein M0804_003442 [Polistes exclamans]|nr:hypothetical protein M0804_003442 [Polistes exclamans]
MSAADADADADADTGGSLLLLSILLEHQQQQQQQQQQQRKDKMPAAGAAVPDVAEGAGQLGELDEPPEPRVRGPSSRAGLMKPLVVLALPGMYLFYKYSQYRREQRELSRRRVTERELQHLHHKIDDRSFVMLHRADNQRRQHSPLASCDYPQ